MTRKTTNRKPAGKARVVAVLAVAAACAFALCGLSGCSQKPAQPETTLSPKVESGTTITDGTLTVGVNGSDSPYAGTNGSGEIVGLDVDLGAALADELGLKLQIVDVDVNGQGALQDKQVDLILDEVQTNANQPTGLSYTAAYINTGISLFCLKENAPESMKSFELGKDDKVLVQANTSAAYAVQETLGADAVQASSTLKDAFAALEAGEQKYLVADAVIGDYFARDYSDMERAGFVSSETVTPVYGEMLSENTELANAIDEALETISQNGTLRAVAAKWLGTGSEDLLPGNVDLSDLPKNAFGSK